MLRSLYNTYDIIFTNFYLTWLVVLVIFPLIFDLNEQIFFYIITNTFLMIDMKQFRRYNISYKHLNYVREHLNYIGFRANSLVNNLQMYQYHANTCGHQEIYFHINYTVHKMNRKVHFAISQFRKLNTYLLLYTQMYYIELQRYLNENS